MLSISETKTGSKHEVFPRSGSITLPPLPLRRETQAQGLGMIMMEFVTCYNDAVYDRTPLLYRAATVTSSTHTNPISTRKAARRPANPANPSDDRASTAASTDPAIAYPTAAPSWSPLTKMAPTVPATAGGVAPKTAILGGSVRARRARTHLANVLGVRVRHHRTSAAEDEARKRERPIRVLCVGELEEHGRDEHARETGEKEPLGVYDACELAREGYEDRRAADGKRPQGGIDGRPAVHRLPQWDEHVDSAGPPD